MNITINPESSMIGNESADIHNNKNHNAIPRISVTYRQKEVLYLIGLGLSNDEIACHLHVAESTVKKYLKKVFEKLGAGSKREALQKASEFGLI